MIEPIDNYMARPVTGTAKPHESGRCDQCLSHYALTQCAGCEKQVCFGCWVECIGCGLKVCGECERQPRWGMLSHEGRCEECGPDANREDADRLGEAVAALEELADNVKDQAFKRKITDMIREALAEWAGAPVPDHESLVGCGPECRCDETKGEKK